MKKTRHTKKRIRILPIIAFILLLGSIPFILRSLQNIQKTEAAWYSDLWGYRVKLTIDDTKVGGANEVFDIGHEDGNLSQYTTTITDGGNLSVSTSAALNGSAYGLSVLVNDGNQLSAEKTLTKSTKLRYRFYLDPNSITMADTDEFLAHYTKQDGGGYGTISNVKLGYTTVGGYKLTADVVGDAGWINEYSTTITDAPHYVEIYVSQATNATSSDGTWQFWVDGSSVASYTGIDNYNRMADYNWFMQYGMIEGRDVGTSGTIYIDDIIVNSDGVQIGSVLTDFPVYVDLSTLPAAFHSHVHQTDARDIRVTKSDGTTELPREVSFYNASTKTGELHVKYSGTLSSSTDTSIYIYYGNPTATDYAASATYGKNNVWDSSTVAVWHLSETSGHHINSTSTSSLDTSTETVTQQGANVGKVGRADEFNGTSDDLAVPSNSSFRQAGDFTIQAWVKLDTLAGTLGHSSSIVCRHLTASPYEEYCLYNNSVTNRLLFTNTSVEFTGGTATTNTAVSANTWYHVVGVKSGTNMKIYVNGSTSGTTDGTFVGTYPNQTGDFFIGDYDSNNNNETDGIIDEVRLSNTARSSTWISTEYNNQNNPSTFFVSTSKEEKRTSAVLNFPFDEGTGTTTYDASAHGYNGTLSGATLPAWQTEDLCVSGKCLYYNGSTAYTSVATSVLSIQSVSFWVRPKTTSETLMDFDGGTHYLSASSGTITATGFSSPTIYVNGISGGTLTANTWQHVEVTTATAFTASAIAIGKQSTNYLNGFVDELRIYDYARTAAQVKLDFTSRNSQSGVAARFGPDNTGSLSQGLVGYWKMDETAGPSLDSSGNGNSGTWNNTPTSTTGRYGTGVYFDPATTNKYISVPAATSINNLSAFTISTWVKPAELQSSTEIFSKGWPMHLYFETVSGGLRTQFGLQCSGDDLSLFSTSADNMSLNTWHHISVVWDGSGCALNSVNVYIDGKLIAKHANSDGGTGTKNSDSGNDLIIGNHLNNLTTHQIHGSMDETRLYNRALSPAEVRQLYAWAPGPIGWWKMDENTGQTVNDSSGNGSNGSLGTTSSLESSDPTWKTGKLGSSLHFDGTEDIAIITDTDLLSFRNNTMSIGAWIKRSGNPAASEYILLKGITNWEYRFSLSTSGNLSFILYTSGGASIATVNGVTNVTDGAWHYVSATSDGSTANTYVDGKFDASTTTFSGLMTNTTANLYLGDRSDTVNTFFEGYIDDVKLYNYARSPSQIVEDMNGGHPPGGSPVESDIIHWKFDEANGATVNNAGYGGSSYNGTISGATWYPGGKLGSAIATSTSTNFVSAGDQAFVDNLTGFTAGFWVKPISLATNKALVSKSNMSNQNSFAVVTDNAVSDEVRVHIPTSVSDTGTYFLTSNLDLANDTWSYMNVIYNASESASTRVRVYKNGKEVTGSVTGTLPDKMTTGTTSLLKVGASDSGSYTALNAVFDDIKIYPYSLTYDQILIDYNGKNAMILGSLSTDSDGVTASSSASRVFCVPGDTSTCSPPILWWKMDENTGTTTIGDSSGNGYAGTMNGSMMASDWVQGKLGSALNFDGTNDRLQNTGVSLPTGDFTYSAWIYPTAFSTSNVIFGAPQASIGGNELNVDTDTDGDIDVLLDNGTLVINGTNGLITANRWHHIVLVRSGSSVNTYINGKIDGTGTEPDALSLSSCGINVGSAQSSTSCSAGLGSYFQGRIDDVQIYDYARTAGQIAWTYSKGAPVAWYKFDECTGATAYNAAPAASGQAAGVNATITIGESGTYTSVGTCGSGTATESRNAGTTGKYASAFAVDATNDYAAVNDIGALDFTTAMTVSGWIYSDVLPTTSVKDANIVNKYITTTNQRAYKLIVDKGDNKYYFLVDGDGASGSTASVASDVTFTTGVWHHVVGVFQNSTAYIYVDGVLQSGTSTGGFSTIFNSSADLVIGMDANKTSAANSGKYDDIMLFNYAMTAAQVKMLYNQGSAVRFGP